MHTHYSTLYSRSNVPAIPTASFFTLSLPPLPSRALQRHYTRALLPELYKVVGSASVFGDPVRLFHHLGLGVWSFLASPAAGGAGCGQTADRAEQANDSLVGWHEARGTWPAAAGRP